LLTIKKNIKKIIPKPIIKILKKELDIYKLKKNYKQDMKKYIKYSSHFNGLNSKRHFEAELIFYYHKIEKGLSLPIPRVGFGKNNAFHLVAILEKYLIEYGWDDVSKVALNTLFEYYYFNEGNKLILKDLFTRLEKLKSTLPIKSQISEGGVTEITKALIDKSNLDFEEFAYTRYSIRNFAPGDVSLDIIKKAVHIAQKTPSVCNRQSSKVYVYGDDNFRKEILSYQNGNAGFGDSSSKILIVTSELQDFRGVIERNQSYIDGGMYSMSLIYALHSLGVGTCPLNLSITNETERKLKMAAKISESEVLIMMIAVGNLPDKLKVASSHRRKVEDVMSVY
jgi:nitroreductase